MSRAAPDPRATSPLENHVTQMYGVPRQRTAFGTLLGVALDRQRIEKQDFPTARQGYDKAAVEAHLAAIADEFEHLSLASSASDRVRAIVEAAEKTATQIQRDAHRDALATRQEAEQAARHAREGAGKLSELASALTQHIDESRRELAALVGSLPGSAPEPAAHPAPAPPAELHPPEVSSPPEVSAPPAEPHPPEVSAPPAEPQPPEVAGPPPKRQSSQVSAPAAEVHPPEVSTPAPPERPPAPVAPAAGADQSESARLIALNMALNGSPREETSKYLDDNFQLADREGLIDEVYASVGG